MSRRARSRIVGALALLLALTASRHNFPLRHHLAVRLQSSLDQIVRTSTPSKKSEGVVPSRRHVETRRAEWVKTLALTAGLHPVLRSALEHQDELVRNSGALRLDGPLTRSSEPTTPHYLLAYLPSHPSRSLPPPV